MREEKEKESMEVSEGGGGKGRGWKKEGVWERKEERSEGWMKRRKEGGKGR